MTKLFAFHCRGRCERLKWRLGLCIAYTLAPTISVILDPSNTKEMTWQGNTSAGKMNFAIALVVGFLLSEVVRDLLNAYDSRTNPTCPSRRDGLLDAALTVTLMLMAAFMFYISGWYGILRGDVQLFLQPAATLVLAGRNIRAWTRAQPRQRRPKKR